MHLEAIMVEKSVSDHHCHSVWQGEAGRGSIGRYWGNNRHHLIIRNTHNLQFLVLCPTHSCDVFIDQINLCGSACTLAEHSYIHVICVVSHHHVPLHIFTPFLPTLHQLQMHFLTIYLRISRQLHHTMIIWAWRCTWRPWLSEFGDSLCGRNRVNSENQFEAVTEWVWG